MTYDQRFNQGLQAAAHKFETAILILTAVFAIRILVQIPSVKKRIDEHIFGDWENFVMFGTDVLAFFILAFAWYAYLGYPFYG